MAFHSTGDASIGLCLGLFQKLSIEKPTEENNQQSDHYRCTDEFGQRELPAQERQHDDAEFEDKIGRAHFERHGSRKVGALAEYTPADRHACIPPSHPPCPHSDAL